MHVHKLILPNKLPVLLIDTGGAESATTLLLVGAGSRYETAKNNGIAHFFEHMAFKGSAKYPDSFTISSTIDGMGGLFNAFTAKDYTGYWIKGTADKTGLMLDVLSDMVTSAKLESAEIEKEKGVIVEEINMYEDMPHHKVSEVYDGLMYPQHPLGMEIAGSHETVRSFTREDFTTYIDRLYHPDNATLVIAGGIGKDIDQLRDLVAKTFGVWDLDRSASGQYDFENYHEPMMKKRTAVFHKLTEQAHFVMGYATDYGFHDDRKYSLGVLSAVLGGGMSSRLFTEIREKRGLCYYVHTARDLYAETGSLVTSAGVRCDKDTVNEALKLIVAAHESIAQGKDKDMLVRDVERVKQMLKGQMLLSMEDSQSVASFYGRRLLIEGDVVDIHSIIEKVQNITVDQVIHEAQSIVHDERLRMAIVGPFTESDIII